MEEWIQAETLQGGTFFTLAAVLVSQLPHIRSLKLDCSFVWIDECPGKIVKRVILSQNNTLPTFDSLVGMSPW